MTSNTVTLKYRVSFDSEWQEKTLTREEYLEVLFKAVARIMQESPERFNPKPQQLDSGFETRHHLNYSEETRVLCAPDSSPHQFLVSEPNPSAYAESNWAALKIEYAHHEYEWVFALLNDGVYVPVPVPALLTVNMDGDISGDEILFPKKFERTPNDWWPLMVFEPEKYELLGRLWHLFAKDKDNALTWIFRKEEALANILTGQLARIEKCARRILAVE